MLIERKDKDNLNVQLHITVKPEDYEAKFEEELLRQGKKVQLKGFRKGKVPKSYLKKAFGKSVLADIVLNETSRSLSEFIQEEKLNTLGRPLASEEQGPMDFDPMEIGTYNFVFDIGLEPEFEVAGVDEKDVYKRPVVEVDEAEVDDEMDRARLRMGTEKSVEGDIEENDRLELNATELNGEGEPHKATFQVLVNMIGDEKVMKKIKKSKVGDEFEFNPFTLEKNAKEHYVKKHMLALEDEDAEIGDKWKATIESIKRIDKADLDEEFLKGFFGDEVKTEEEAREKMRDQISEFYRRQGEALLFRSFQDALLEKNKVELPEEFLQRWLKTEKEEQNARQEEQISTDISDEEWADFKRGLTWTIIRDKIADQGKVEVTDQEILHHFMNSIRQYLGAYAADENLLRHSAERLMQNQEQVRKAYETIKDDKVFNYIVTQVTIKDDKVNKEELEKRIEAVKQ